ncbi:MAG: FG-GAP-like repeat-containing protein [Cytophagales bacterium]|nr:FG-GAP-like repeat-containing protein [Cytophagales bacterium]
MKRILLTTLLFVTILFAKAQSVYYSLIPDFSSATESSLSISLSEESLGTDIEFSNDGLKLFVLGSSTDAMYEYNLSEAFSITSASYSGFSLYVGGQDINPQGFVFNQDGSRMFMVGSSSGAVHEYELSTAFDLSSAIETGVSFTISTQDTSPTGVEFNPAGDKMYILGAGGDNIYEYDLSTPFSLTTASYNSSFLSVSSQSSNPSDLEFSPDGKYAFVLDATSNNIFTYGMSTAHQLTSASFVNEMNLSNSSSNTGFAFSKDFARVAMINSSSSITDFTVDKIAFKESVENDGTLDGSIIVTVVGDTLIRKGEALVADTEYSINNLISDFTPVLSVDASGLTATLSLSGRTTSDQDTLDVSSVQFTFADTAFVTSNAVDVTNATGPAESNLGINLDAGFNQPRVFYGIEPTITEATLSGNSISPTNDSFYQDFTYSGDGSKLFLLGTSDSIHQYDLSVAFDISSASDANISFYVGSEDTTPQALQFDATGRRLFVLGNVNDAIFQYDLTSEFDISTASYSGTSLSVGIYDSSPAGFAFSGSGDRIFLVGNGGRTIDQLNLPGAYNIASVSSSSTLTLTTSNTYTTISFSANGKSFYVGTTSSIIQYDLTTPYSVTGVTSVGTLPLSTVSGNYLSFRFNPGLTGLVTLNSSRVMDAYTLPAVAFNETEDNDGQLEGAMIARVVRGNFNSEITSDDVTIVGIPSGFTPSVALGDDLQHIEISLTGQTKSNDAGNSVSDIQISFGDGAFEDFTAAEVINATESQTGLEISFTAGSNIPEPLISYSKLPNISNVSDTVFQSLDIVDLQGFIFNNDGSRLYALRTSVIDEYLLSTNYDISTATLNFTFSISLQETAGRGLAFNDIGTRLYVIGGTREINVFRFSLAYDLSTASFDSVITTFTDDTAPTDIAFNDDGSKMYLLGDTNNSIFEYFLSTAFDPTTAVLETTFSLGTSVTGPQGFSFTQDGSSFFVVDNLQDRFYQFDLSTAFDISTATAKLINVSIATNLSTPTAIQLSGDGKRLLITGNTADKIFEYSFPVAAFIESSANDGLLEGKLIARIIGDVFNNAGGSFTQSEQLEISEVPLGLDPNINISSSGSILTLDYTGNAINNDTINDVDNIAIAFADEAFKSSRASEVATTTGSDYTNLGISYTAGSDLFLEMELSENNDVIADIALNGNRVTLFSWLATAGTDTTVVDSLTIAGSYDFDSLLIDFTLWAGTKADGSDRTMLAPDTIAVSDSLVSFGGIADTLFVIEEVYYFVQGLANEVADTTDAINFQLASSNLTITGSTVVETTLTGSNISFTNAAFSPIQAGTIDSVAYGETKLVDIDNDDDLDIIAAGTDNDGNDILKYFTNTNGVFAAGVAFGTAKDSVRLAAGDLDNDLLSQIDLLVQGFATDSNGGTLYDNDLNNIKDFAADSGNLILGDIATGDFDGDGDLDIIMSGQEDTDAANYKIRIFQNNGSNDYTVIDSLTMNPIIRGDIEIGDVDNDGDLDVFLTGLDSLGNPVAVLHLGDSTGFEESTTSTFTAVSQSAADFGDYNGDGYLDLVVSGTVDGTSDNILSVIYSNDGDGSFTASTLAVDSVYAGDVKWIDVDSDGDQDLVETGIARTDTIASIWINDNATFTVAENGNLLGLSNGNISYGDIDGDDDLDLVINGVDSTANFVTTIYENALFSGFVSEVAQPDSIGLSFMDSKIVIGWDSLPGAQYEVIVVKTDSLENVEVIRSADSRRLTGFVRNPEKARIRNATYEVNNAERAAYRVGVQRINSISKGSEFRRIENFFFGKPFTPVATEPTNLATSSFTANWNNQTAIDSFAVTLIREEIIGGEETLVTVGTFGTNENSFRFNNLRRNRNYRYSVKAINAATESDTSNEIRVILPISSLFIASEISGLTNDTYESLAMADFDDDDNLDVVASNGTSGFVLLNGSASAINFMSSRSSTSMEVFDFGNDGDQDIFVTGTLFSVGRTTIYQNNGATFTETVTNSSQFLEADIASGDIDNDGDVDVILMGQADGTIKTELLINNGSNFDASSQTFIADSQGDLEFSDFDLDGDLDLLIMGTTEAILYINESGTFTAGTSLTFDFLSDVDLKLEDMTGDGRPDVIYSGATGGSSFIKIYSTNEALEFEEITDLDVTTQSSGAPKIEVIDGDNNGTLDVMLIGTEAMEVYSNTTNGVLTDTEALIINISGVSNAATAIGDYDKDGDVDLLYSGVTTTNTEDAGLLSNANDTGNESPTAPTNLDITFPNGNWQLQWDPSTDDKTATNQLTYNVLIQSETENLTYQSANPDNGFRKVTGYGAIQDTTWLFDPVDLPIGEYTWTVQAIDANGQGSEFSPVNPLTVPDTVKIFNNQPAIASGQIDGGTENVVFFSFGINATNSSTLDSLAFTLNGDYSEYLEESTLKLFRSVDANPDLSPEDQVVDAQASSDGTTLSISGLSNSLSQQQVYFFLVAQAKFVAAAGEFQVTLDAANVFIQETGFVNEAGSLTGPLISIRNAVTTYTPGNVSNTNFEASTENQQIMVFSANANVPGVSLQGVNIAASEAISDRFENIRLFSSTDNSLSGADTELGTFMINESAMSLEFNSALPGSGTDLFYFVVADIVSTVSQSTPAITLTLNSPADLTFSSTELNTLDFTTSEYTFFFDLVPPTVRYDSFEENVRQGSGPHSVSFTVQDQSEITEVDFFWRKLAESSFQQVAQTVTANGTYSFEFSATDIGSVGVEFYAAATDLDGNTNDPEVRSIGIFFDSTDPIDFKSEANIKLEGESVTDYSLIAFPFQSGRFSDVLSGLENAEHGGLAELFAGDDNTKYRIVGLRNGATDASGFQNLTLSSTFNPGAGYYLIVGVKEADIQVVSAETVEASSDDPHSVSLSAGWNMIGNPYLFPISIESIRDYNLAVGNISDASVINDFRLFKNGQFVTNPSTMERFDGAFIRVTESVSNFEFPMNDEIPSNSGGRIELTRWDEVVDEDSWRLDLTIKQGNQLSLGGFGIKEDAANGEDIYDQYVLPAPGNYIRLQHEIDEELTVIRNAIKAPELVNVWNTSLHAVRDGRIALEWDHESVSGLARSLYLFDPVGVRFIDMKAQGSTSVSVAKGANELLFFYGPEDLKEEIMANQIMAVGQVYPNPVTDLIGINLLGQVGTEVSITLFDLNGKEILGAEEMLTTTGVNTMEVAIDRRLRSGLYFLEVQLSSEAGTYRSKQKILIND